MEDWERKLMEKVVEDMRNGEDQIYLRSYSEAMMWYSDEKMLKVSPDTKMYDLSPHAVLFSVADNLYLQTLEGFDMLGGASQLLIQLKSQEAQTGDEQRSAKAQEILNSFDWLKSEALKRFNEAVPGLEIDSVEVVSIGYEPSNKDWLPEDGDMMLWLNLELCLLDVSVEQLDKLTGISDNTLVHRVNIEETPITYEVWHSLSYDFTFWSGRLEDNFVKNKEE